VNFSVTDPTNGNAPYNILTDAPFVGIDPGTGKPVCASKGTAKLAFDIAWDSRDYTNWGSGATSDDWGQPITLNALVGAGCATNVPPSAVSGPDAHGRLYVDLPHRAAGSTGGQLPARGCRGMSRDQQRGRRHGRTNGGGHDRTGSGEDSGHERGRLRECKRRHACGAAYHRRQCQVQCMPQSVVRAWREPKRQCASLHRLPQSCFHRCERSAGARAHDAGYRWAVGAIDRFQIPDSLHSRW
jgi:hypothetical protein